MSREELLKKLIDLNISPFYTLDGERLVSTADAKRICETFGVRKDGLRYGHILLAVVELDRNKPRRRSLESLVSGDYQPQEFGERRLFTSDQYHAIRAFASLKGISDMCLALPVLLKWQVVFLKTQEKMRAAGDVIEKLGIPIFFMLDTNVPQFTKTGVEKICAFFNVAGEDTEAIMNLAVIRSSERPRNYTEKDILAHSFQSFDPKRVPAKDYYLIRWFAAREGIADKREALSKLLEYREGLLELETARVKNALVKKLSIGGGDAKNYPPQRLFRAVQKERAHVPTNSHQQSFGMKFSGR